MGELNLIPYEFKSKKESKGSKQSTVLIAILVIAVLGLGIGIPYFYLSQLNQDLSTVNGKVTKAQSDVNKTKSAQDKLKAYNKQIDLVNTLSPTNDKSGDNFYLTKNRIDGIKKYRPSVVVMTNVVYDIHTQFISLLGTSTDYDEINKFVANLQMSDDYKNAKLESIATLDNTGNAKSQSWIFSINIDCTQGGVQNAKSK